MAATTIKDGFAGGSDNQLKVNADGSINVTSSGGGSSNVNIHDSSGGTLNSTAGALNVTTTGTVTSHEAGLTNFQPSQQTVGTSVVQITPTPLTNRSSISLRTSAAPGQAVYISNVNTVTTSTGWPLFNGDTIQMDLTPTNNIYAIASANGQTLFILEMA